MVTISTALTHAFRLLRNDLYVHIDEAEQLAMMDADWSDDDTESARKLILDLIEVIRTTIAQHEENNRGGCRFCRSPRWPCPTVESVHSVLRSPEREFVRLVNAARS